MGSIYKITNTVNGKGYIGQTINDAVKGRISNHLNGNSQGSQLVKRAINKYGKEVFIYEILHDGIIAEFLDMLEVEAIKKYDTLVPNGYNLTTGGHSGTVSEETKRKISKSLTGRRLSEETKRKLSKANKGKVLSGEHRIKFSQAQKGKKLSAEARKKLSEAHKGKNYGRVGENHHMYGKTHSDEAKRKISKAGRGRPSPKKGKPGKPHTAETRKKISNSLKGRNPSQEHCLNISKAKAKKQLGMSAESFTILVKWLLDDGWTKKQIADALNKSLGTIYKYSKIL